MFCWDFEQIAYYLDFRRGWFPCQLRLVFLQVVASLSMFAELTAMPVTVGSVKGNFLVQAEIFFSSLLPPLQLEAISGGSIRKEHASTR